MSILEIAICAGKEYKSSKKGTLCLTPYAERIVEIVRNDPARIKEYENEFIQMWRQPKVIPHELLAISMFHLKLDAVKKYIENYRGTELSNNNWRAEGPTRDVLSAYEEPWEDYDLYYEDRSN